MSTAALLRTNRERLWSSLMVMAEMGATAHGGVRRLALSEEDRRGRDLFTRWCHEAGLRVNIDAVGNLFARRAGALPDQAPVLVGSHLDTQPEGGRFDGVYGVLAALELVRTLNEHRIVTDKPIEIVSWTNEEGARFAPPMLGSAVFVGDMPLAQALATPDANGILLKDALADCGYAGDSPVGKPIDAYFEAHIEQGPILEQQAVPIGVVSGAQAVRWLDLTIEGVAAHAGTTPMPQRKDAYLAAAAMALALEGMTQQFAPQAMATIGQIAISNASRNTIAGIVHCSLDLRHPADDVLDALLQAVHRRFLAIAQERNVTLNMESIWHNPATPFDTACVDSVRAAACQLGYGYQHMVSGAGHDAIPLARHVPTAMVFIPCAGGLSHNAHEYALPEHVAAGADVLLHAVLARAGRHTAAQP